MGLLDQLSSLTGDKTQQSNRSVAEQCLADPSLLSEVEKGLTQPQTAGDCAEVFTMVAEINPDLIISYCKTLINCLDNKTTRVRWEAAHALALTAGKIPNTIAQNLNLFYNIFNNDNSIIVRDYTADILSAYASTSPDTAIKVWPVLQNILTAWDGRHAGHAIAGLEAVAGYHPELHQELYGLCEPLLQHKKKVIQKSINKFLKTLKA